MPLLEQIAGTQTGLVAAFVVTAAIVVLAGIRLSVYGDALGDRTGLGHGLVGLLFLAAVTSLPELVVSLTAVIRSTDAGHGADLATGNMLGSNIFNLLILALAALLFPRRFVPARLKGDHTASIVYGAILLLMFSAAFLLAGRTGLLVPGLQCSWGVLLLPAAYVLFLRREHRQADTAKEDNPLPAEEQLATLPALRFYSSLAGLSLLIILGGTALSSLGSRMALPAEEGGFGLEATLIGTIFLAISTSLPELVISFASIRMGFLDMAVSNVLGSNMFNLLIIFAADTAMRGRNMLEHASPHHWTSAAVILLLTGLTALLLRSRTRGSGILISIAMIGLYIAVMAFWA